MKISETSFFLLGANIHSSRIEIRNLVEEKSFIEDEQECRNAERNLLQSNKRIEQEIAWLPGVPPEIADRLVKSAEKGQFSRKYTYHGAEIEIPALAACNLLSETVYHILKSRPESIDVTQFDAIVRLAVELYDLVEIDDVLNLINSDRAVAGYSQLADKQLVAENIDKQRKELSVVINQVLCIFSEDDEKEWLTGIIKEITKGGAAPLPSLFEELLCGYELRKMDFHSQLEQEISKLISEIEKSVQNNFAKETQQNIALLKSLLEKWSSSLYPVLLAYKSKGGAHKTAESIISDVRTLYIRAVEDYNDEEIFSSLGESLAFAIDTVPKFSDLVKKDLIFLHGRFSDFILLKKIKSLCSSYEKLPQSKESIVSSFKQLKQQLSSELRCKLGVESGDWLCLLFIKYGVALANFYNDFRNALLIFKESLILPSSDRIKKLVEDNIRKCERNGEFLKRKEIENEKKRRLYIINQEKQQKENKKKNIYATVICAVLACCCALGVWYVNSPEYEWDYISTLPLENKVNYLNNHPSSLNKRQLSRLIVEQIVALPEEQIDYYIGRIVLVEDAAFEELTASPTIQGLSLFLKLFPEASTSRKQTVRELQSKIAYRDWERLSEPYTLDIIQNFLSTYEGMVDPREIQRRVYASIVQSADATYLASFMDYISKIPLETQVNYLNNNSSAENKKKISRLIVQQIAALPEDKINYYIGKVMIDEDAAFEELTVSPTIQSLSLFLKLFPDASMSHKQVVRALQTEIAYRDWESLKEPYTMDIIQGFLSTYDGIVDPWEIQRRVYASIIKSTDAVYLASFLDYIKDKPRKDRIVSRIGEIELENWTRTTLRLTSISELVSYRETLITEAVKLLVDQKIAELEERTWREKYSNSTSESTLLKFQKSLRSEKVKKLVEIRLQELYASFAFAQQKDTIEAYKRFISLSNNRKEKEKARRRIIDLEVAEIARGRYSELPPQHSNAYQYTRTGVAEIEIKNDTAYPLTAMYSGKKSEKVVIPAYESKTIKIRSGEYAIAVTTTQPNVIPFYGNETIESGKYQVTYYISSSPAYQPKSDYLWP